MVMMTRQASLKTFACCQIVKAFQSSNQKGKNQKKKKNACSNFAFLFQNCFEHDDFLWAELINTINLMLTKL